MSDYGGWLSGDWVMNIVYGPDNMKVQQSITLPTKYFTLSEFLHESTM